MSIHSTFESTNTPLNELLSLIRYTHPNILSKKIRFIEPDSKQLASSGLSISHEDLYFVLERDVKLPISASLIKRVLGSDHSVVKLLTYVKITVFATKIITGQRPVQVLSGLDQSSVTQTPMIKVDMITSVPKCFHSYVNGHEIVSFKSDTTSSGADGSTKTIGSFTLKYKLIKSEEEGILASFGFSISSVTNNFLDMSKDIIIKRYSVKRKEHFGQPLDTGGVADFEEFKTALREFL